MRISICVPTWEQYGNGKVYLNNLLETINKQTFKNFEVIISDHSEDSSILDVVKKFYNFFEIKYFKNEIKRGNSPANTNNALKNAEGEIIKIIFQDDFFYTNDSLNVIQKTFEKEKCFWLVNGCNHITENNLNFHNFMVPKWNSKIVLGKNTISSPSVLSFINDKTLYFDENLTMLMDCEFYYQLYLKYGHPQIVEDCLITNRLHKNQISKLYNKNINEEIEYIKTKYKL